jgi:hypothetical protein
MSVDRVPIQRQELEAALAKEPDGVIRRAAEAVAAVMDGRTIIIEERVGVIGNEEWIEETVLEASVPT